MSRKKGPPGLQHVGIESRTIDSKYWQQLIPAAKIFYIHLKRRHNGRNNGEIRLPYSAMRDVKGCSADKTISKAIKELEKKGWIKVTKHGGLYRHDNLFKLTFKYDFYGAEHATTRFRDKNKI